jgi:hypothetical protein
MNTDRTAAPVRPAARAASLRRDPAPQARPGAPRLTAAPAPSFVVAITATPAIGAVAASVRAASPAVPVPAA